MTLNMENRIYSALGLWMLLAVILSVGCAGSVPVLQLGETEGMDRVRTLYEQEEFARTVLGVGEFLSKHPGSKYREEAQFLRARANYEEGMYLETEEQLRRFLRDFPTGPYAEEANYYLGLALLSQARGIHQDQTEAEAAHVQFRSFLSRYPDSEFAEGAQKHIDNIRSRFAEKHFESGMVYHRQRTGFRAARFYFEERVIEVYPETTWAKLAMIKLAESYKKTGDWAEVAEWTGRYLSENPNGEDGDKANKLLAQAKEHLDRAASETPSSP